MHRNARQSTGKKVGISTIVRMYSARNIGFVIRSAKNLAPLKYTLRGIPGHRLYAGCAHVSRQYTQDDVDQFKSTFPEVCTDLTNMARKYDNTCVPNWFSKSLCYNANGGKMNRGQMTVIAYKMLVSESQLTRENIKLAHYVGWMTEVCEGAILMVDDLIDRSVMRRNKPCWHTLPEIQMNSINDLIMLENVSFLGLKKYIGHKDYYPRVFRLFTEGLFRATLANTTDLIMCREPVRSLTMERMENIVRHSTCFTGFVLPVNLAMEMCGYKNRRMYTETNEILTEVALFFKIRNDYLDCFGDFDKTGKESNDIVENKPTWLAVKAMERADSNQREIMETCYGQKDPQKAAQIESLYKEMEIDKLYLEYEKDTFERINNMIANMSFDNFKPLLQTLWNLIYYYK